MRYAYTVEVTADPPGNPYDPVLLQTIEDTIDEGLCHVDGLAVSAIRTKVLDDVVAVLDTAPPDGPALEQPEDLEPCGCPTHIVEDCGHQEGCRELQPAHDGPEAPLPDSWRPEPGQIAELPDSPWLYASAPIPAKSRGTVRAVDTKRAIVTVTAPVTIDIPIDQLTQVVPG